MACPRRVLTRPALDVERPTAVVWTALVTKYLGPACQGAWAFLSQHGPITPSILICFPLTSMANMRETDEYKEAWPTIPYLYVFPLI